MELYVDNMLVKIKKENHHLNDLRETFETLRLYRIKLNPSKCVFGVLSGKFLGFMVSYQGVEASPNKIQAILEISPLKNVKEVQSLNKKSRGVQLIRLVGDEQMLAIFQNSEESF